MASKTRWKVEDHARKRFVERAAQRFPAAAAPEQIDALLITAAREGVMVENKTRCEESPVRQASFDGTRLTVVVRKVGRSSRKIVTCW